MDGNLRMRCLAAILGIFCGSGCIERTVTINTEPDGATVFLNDQEVGKSPVKVPFTWYGDYDIIVRKPGYETLKTHHRVDTPWYELPGVDLFTECLIPFTVHDDRVIDTLVLNELELPTKEALLEAAAEMQEQARAASSPTSTATSESASASASATTSASASNATPD